VSGSTGLGSHGIGALCRRARRRLAARLDAGRDGFIFGEVAPLSVERSSELRTAPVRDAAGWSWKPSMAIETRTIRWLARSERYEPQLETARLKPRRVDYINPTGPLDNGPMPLELQQSKACGWLARISTATKGPWLGHGLSAAGLSRLARMTLLHDARRHSPPTRPQRPRSDSAVCLA